MTPVELLKKEYENFTRAEQTIADFIIENPLTVIRLPLTDIAREAKASNTAIIRLCQKLGYQGFSEFKFSMSRAALSDTGHDDCIKQTETSNPMEAIANQYIYYINMMVGQIDMADLTAIASRVCDSRHLAIMGYNRTGFSASQLSYRLSKLGVANYLVTDIVVMKDYMEILGTGDTCIIFSITTSSASYKDIAGRLKKNGANVIVITMNPASPLKKLCTSFVCLPKISTSRKMGFLDDQALFFIFIEGLLSEIASRLS